jgi:hypothetical protein
LAHANLLYYDAFCTSLAPRQLERTAA